jgi:hypothetical protein
MLLNLGMVKAQLGYGQDKQLSKEPINQSVVNLLLS